MSIVVNNKTPKYNSLTLSEQANPELQVNAGENLVYVSDGTVNGSIGDLRMKISDSGGQSVVDRLCSARIPYIKSVHTAATDINWNGVTTVNLLNINLTVGVWLMVANVGAYNADPGGNVAYFWISQVSGSDKTSINSQTVPFYAGGSAVRGCATITTVYDVTSATTYYFNGCLNGGTYTGPMVDYSTGTGKTDPDAGCIFYAVRLT